MIEEGLHPTSSDEDQSLWSSSFLPNINLEFWSIEASWPLIANNSSDFRDIVIKQYAEQVEKLTNDLSILDTKNQKIEKNLKQLTKNVTKNVKALSKNKTDFITMSGIFISIFTFISIEIKILTEITDLLRLSGFTIILASLLIWFVLLIHIVASKRINDEYSPPPEKYHIAAILWVLIWIILVTMGDYNNPSVTKINNKIAELTGKITIFEEQLKLLEKKVEIQDSEKTVDHDFNPIINLPENNVQNLKTNQTQ